LARIHAFKKLGSEAHREVTGASDQERFILEGRLQTNFWNWNFD